MISATLNSRCHEMAGSPTSQPIIPLCSAPPGSGAQLKSLRGPLELDEHLSSPSKGSSQHQSFITMNAVRGTGFGAVAAHFGIPYVDGRKVVCRTRQRDCEVQITRLTGWGNGALPAATRRNTSIGYLSKPRKMGEFSSRLRELVRGRNNSEENAKHT
jgi:hypothetical protein